MSEVLATCTEIAQFLRVQPSTVRRLAAQGEVPAFKVGRQWRFSMSKVREWAERRSDESGAPDADTIEVEPL